MIDTALLAVERQARARGSSQRELNVALATLAEVVDGMRVSGLHPSAAVAALAAELAILLASMPAAQRDVYFLDLLAALAQDFEVLKTYVDHLPDGELPRRVH